jgi:hypothetical protein
MVSHASDHPPLACSYDDVIEFHSFHHCRRLPGKASADPRHRLLLASWTYLLTEHLFGVEPIHFQPMMSRQYCAPASKSALATMPMLARNLNNFVLSKALVITSATMSSVLQYCSFTVPSLTASFMA